MSDLIKFQVNFTSSFGQVARQSDGVRLFYCSFPLPEVKTHQDREPRARAASEHPLESLGSGSSGNGIIIRSRLLFGREVVNFSRFPVSGFEL